jgi:hypothetical protein
LSVPQLLVDGLRWGFLGLILAIPIKGFT